MVGALICREFGWTYHEYLAQPASFIDAASSLLNREAEARNKHSKS